MLPDLTSNQRSEASHRRDQAPAPTTKTPERPASVAASESEQSPAQGRQRRTHPRRVWVCEHVRLRVHGQLSAAAPRKGDASSARQPKVLIRFINSGTQSKCGEY